MRIQDLTLKLSRKMAIPQMGRDPEGTLKSVILLARELEYQQKRRRVYEKQDHILRAKGPPLKMCRNWASFRKSWPTTSSLC